MELVVDSNVIISAVLNRGNSLRVFTDNFLRKRFNLIAPEFIVIELGKHSNRIAKNTNFSQNELIEMIEFVINEINFISEKDYSDNLQEARNILKTHEKDVPYLALALKYNCKIFSGDKIFKQLCPEKVLNPREILELFN